MLHPFFKQTTWVELNMAVGWAGSRAESGREENSDKEEDGERAGEVGGDPSAPSSSQ